MAEESCCSISPIGSNAPDGLKFVYDWIGMQPYSLSPSNNGSLENWSGNATYLSWLYHSITLTAWEIYPAGLKNVCRYWSNFFPSNLLSNSARPIKEIMPTPSESSMSLYGSEITSRGETYLPVALCESSYLLTQTLRYPIPSIAKSRNAWSESFLNAAYPSAPFER